MSEVEDDLERMLVELSEFHGSERYAELLRKFWKKQRTVFEFIRPRWTLEKSALVKNWEISESERESCSLRHFQRSELAKSLDQPDVFRFPGNWLAMSDSKEKALFILHHWLEGRDLTPPVLTLGEDGTWTKRDGFHRLVLAMMCDTSTIPIWVLESTESES